MKNILITGTSTGIGAAAAKVFASAEYRVFSVVRRKKDADNLKKEARQYEKNIVPLIFDITDEKAIRRNAQKVSKILGEDSGLVAIINNAGIALSGPITNMPLSEVRYQFEVNVIGHVAVIQAFFPLLKRGQNISGWKKRIINISSFGGAIGIPYLGAYSASKHGLEGLSTVLRREMRLYGIDVIIIRPAGTYTAIWEKSPVQNTETYSTSDYIHSGKVVQQYLLKVGKSGATSDEIGNFIKNIFDKKKPRAIYTYLPKVRFNWLLTKISSPRMLDFILAFKFKLKPIKPK